MPMTSSGMPSAGLDTSSGVRASNLNDDLSAYHNLQPPTTQKQYSFKNRSFFTRVILPSFGRVRWEAAKGRELDIGRFVVREKGGAC